MIELVQGNISERIIVTLNEKKTLENPFYLFVFTHSVTKGVVAFIAGADQSLFPDRYNEFEINTAVKFLNKPTGEWLYEVYEQESDTNTNPANSTGLVENGKMRLRDSEEFEYTAYDQGVTYKAYDGE